VKQQLLLGSKRTPNKALRQALELEIVKLVVRSSVRLRKMSDRTLWRGQPPFKRKSKWQYAYGPLRMSSHKEGAM
jgi:hypothetical protein